ncbi:aspartate aminotransferase family protein [Chloroflexota bacterium]
MSLYESNIKGMSPVWTRIFPIDAEKAEGAYIYSTTGERYLDFTCGIGVTNTGHCHPEVVEAIREQAGLFIHAQANIVVHQPMLRLISELKQIVPEQINSFFFSNSGAEAVEGAVKLARASSGKTNIIVFSGSFHGRTAGTMALTTSKTIFRSGFQPLPAGVFVAPYPNSYKLQMSDKETTNFCLNSLEELLITQTSPSETAAILMEPVLGEGGYVVPPKGFLKSLRKLADKYNILLILDEIQSGYGRTGKWFGYEHFDIIPDILTVAKGIASGLPLSGVFSSIDLMKEWEPGSHGGTFGGNALACAAGVATIQVIRNEDLIRNTNVRGSQLLTGLRKIQENHPIIGDVRGLGLMIGTEFTDEKRKPVDKLVIKQIIKKCEENGLLLLSCGTYDNVIRWIPPLIVNKDQIKTSLDIFEDSIKSVIEID